MIIAGVIPAAGSGQRLGGGQPKALRMLGGKALYHWAWEALRTHRDISVVVVAAPAVEREAMAATLPDTDGFAQTIVVAGGLTRQESVLKALEALPDSVTHILVHDAARPFVDHALIDRVIAGLRAGHLAVIPGLPVVDTIKRVASDGAHGEAVVETVDRDTLRAVQTPQGFQRRMLMSAHTKALSNGTVCTDDAMMLESQAIPVSVVPGSPEAFKITTPMDFIVAECLLQRSRIDAAP